MVLRAHWRTSYSRGPWGEKVYSDNTKCKQLSSNHCDPPLLLHDKTCAQHQPRQRNHHERCFLWRKEQLQRISDNTRLGTALVSVLPKTQKRGKLYGVRSGLRKHQVHIITKGLPARFNAIQNKPQQDYAGAGISGVR